MEDRGIDIAREFFEARCIPRYEEGERIYQDSTVDKSVLKLVTEGAEELCDQLFYLALALKKLSPQDGRMRIFVSGPYSGEEEEVANNIEEAEKACVGLLKKGHDPICPHLQFAHFDSRYPDIPYERYLGWCLRMISLCHGILMVKGWMKSPGAEQELEEAELAGLKIYYSIVEVPLIENGQR